MATTSGIRTFWCVSAWNDQASHTRHRMQEGYCAPTTSLGSWMDGCVPYLGGTARHQWPAAPTTGWDHWMRLGTTSHGRECVAPEINRSRHASKRGTNVLDNKPFERFAFEKVGVQTFGDLSYLLRDKPRLRRKGSSSLQSVSRGAAHGASTQFESAVGWMGQLRRSEPPQLPLYSAEARRA